MVVQVNVGAIPTRPMLIDEVWTMDCGHTFPTTEASARSTLRPSHTMKKVSLAPRLRSSVSRLIQNFEPSHRCGPTGRVCRVTRPE